MTKVLVLGNINVETTVAIDGFPLHYSPVRYVRNGIQQQVSAVGYNMAKALKTLRLSAAEVQVMRFVPDFCTAVSKMAAPMQQLSGRSFLLLTRWDTLHHQRGLLMSRDSSGCTAKQQKMHSSKSKNVNRCNSGKKFGFDEHINEPKFLTSDHLGSILFRR